MTYRDRTWCWAKCKADGTCGRKLTELGKKIVRDNRIPVSYADFSNVCTWFIPDDLDGGEDATKT